MKIFLSTLLFVLLMCFSVCLKALEKSDSVRLTKIVLRAYYYTLSNPDSAITLANIVLAKTIQGSCPYLQGFGYNVLAKANWTKGNYRLSAHYGFKALKILENSPHIHLWGETLLSLGRTFVDLHDFNQAKVFLDQANRLAFMHTDSLLLADTYREKSMLFSETIMYDSALYSADEALVFYEQEKDSLHISILYGRKAKIYLIYGDYKKSSFYNNKALVLDSLVGNMRALAFSYFYAAQNAYGQQLPDSAIKLLRKSISISKRNGNLLALSRAHSLLSQIYHHAGKPTQEIENLQIASHYKDSLHNLERYSQVHEMKLLYDMGSKDKTIALLGHENIARHQQVKDQRTFMILMGAVVVLLFAVILLLVRLRSIQQKTNLALTAKNVSIEQQKEEMQVQAEFLKEMNLLKSKLFSVISHDVRGPIGNLQSLLNLLTAKVMTPEEFLALSDKLKINLNLTQRTLENLLNWSLSQMDGLITEPTFIDLRSAIDESYTLLQEFADRKKVLIEVNIENNFMVWADSNQLQLILRNLIHNAIKFSKAGGKVILDAKIKDELCMVRIKDFGIGLTSEEKIKLLNAQEHFSKSGTHQEKGTGLGFLLCQEFITRNGGKLEICSEPGAGTEITFCLPRNPSK